MSKISTKNILKKIFKSKSEKKVKKKVNKDKANGMVPVNKQSHLRSLATINQVNKCISILKSKPKIKR